MGWYPDKDSFLRCPCCFAVFQHSIRMDAGRFHLGTSPFYRQPDGWRVTHLRGFTSPTTRVLGRMARDSQLISTCTAWTGYTCKRVDLYHAIIPFPLFDLQCSRLVGVAAPDLYQLEGLALCHPFWFHYNCYLCNHQQQNGNNLEKSA